MGSGAKINRARFQLVASHTNTQALYTHTQHSREARNEKKTLLTENAGKLEEFERLEFTNRKSLENSLEPFYQS